MLLRASRAQAFLFTHSVRFYSTATEGVSSSPEQPPPSELDESYQQLLKDVDLSIKRHERISTNAYRSQPDSEGALLDTFQNEAQGERGTSELLKSAQWKRKSAEARFGSDRIGQLKLPFELVTSMQLLIDESDKHQLRSDAKRLLTVPTKAKGNGVRWIADTPKYSTGKDERMRGPREGLAYATITMPGQVAAIRSVLHEAGMRLPAEWRGGVKNVLDFGSQTGPAFWSTTTYFGKQPEGWENQETLLHETTIKRYIGFDNRKGLVSLAKKLQPEKLPEDFVVSYHQFYRDLDEFDLKSLHAEGRQATLAISAFVLSQLPTPAHKKQIVREMWDSDAEVIIIIDQGNKEGFHSVADAREYLLKLGAANGDAHVVAPCPHDGICPLRATPDICSFNQRFLRPEFHKKTKHAKRAFEDSKYSYVIIRRGPRPQKPKSIAPAANMAAIADTSPQNLNTEMSSDVPFQDDTDSTYSSGLEVVDPEPLNKGDKGKHPNIWDSLSLETERQAMERKYRAEVGNSRLQEYLRLSSYHWRRSIYPPMKGSGHVTLDTCTPRGEIARIVIPRSQGKQEYYDARKSAWGDLFPHEPRNGEVIRKRGICRLGPVSGLASKAVELPDEDMAELKKTLSGVVRDSFAEQSKSMPRMEKSDRRENHRRRKQWRNQEESGYR